MNYWSCTKIADAIRGTPKPMAATSREWREWKKKAKAAHPVRFWITEEALDGIQRALRAPLDALYSIKCYINNRWVSKTHMLASHSLKPGQWHEFDTRVIHCLFDQFVDFVEIEQASHHIAWDKKAREQFSAPWWACGWFRWHTWRHPEAGLSYLRWGAALVYDDDWCGEDSPNYGKPTPQAEACKEALELYNWWKNVRPQRLEPEEASGWVALCEQRREREQTMLWEDKTEQEQETTRATLDRCHEIERAYNEEDDQMLIRLIKLRRSLWT